MSSSNNLAPFSTDRGLVDMSTEPLRAGAAGLPPKGKVPVGAIAAVIVVGILVYVVYVATSQAKKKKNDADATGTAAVATSQQVAHAPVIVATACDSAAAAVVAAPVVRARKIRGQVEKEVEGDLGYVHQKAAGAKNFAEISDVWATSSAGTPPRASPHKPYASSGDKGQVIQVTTDAEFSAHVDNQKRHAVVVFSQDWCGHCKTLVEPFAQAAREVPSVPFIRVNCARINPETLKRFDVMGFPHIVKTNGQSHVPCHGRSVEALTKFARM